MDSLQQHFFSFLGGQDIASHPVIPHHLCPFCRLVRAPSKMRLTFSQMRLAFSKMQGAFPPTASRIFENARRIFSSEGKKCSKMIIAFLNLSATKILKSRSVGCYWHGVKSCSVTNPIPQSPSDIGLHIVRYREKRDTR